MATLASLKQLTGAQLEQTDIDRRGDSQTARAWSDSKLHALFFLAVHQSGATRRRGWPGKVANTCMWTRGVRGATCAKSNTKADIVETTAAMLTELIERNRIDIADIGSAFFSTTPDLTAEFPAIAARQLGWRDVPLMCMHEMAVPGSLPLCVRVMVLWNTTKSAVEIRHVYMNGAERLRPDLIQEG